MQVYLVGGAVRDQLLGLPVKEKDWVVIGCTPEEMQVNGFIPVGKDFPVFLHPETHEEYALARTERKTGMGYKGFVFHAAPDVSLEEDLKRRDLTINAMAQTADGRLIDPFSGKADLDNRILRHVSAAFMEDPVRCLRLARFAARFTHLGFAVAPETYQLVHRMVENQEIDALVPERIWQELERALGEAHPEIFFHILRQCNALKALFPEIDVLFGIPNPKKYHPEIDTGIHTLMVLEQAARLTQDKTVRFAALLHDVGKALTPKETWPKHEKHEVLGIKLIHALCARIKVPRAYQELAILTARYHLTCHQAKQLKPSTLHDFLIKLDALRRPERFKNFLLACEADVRGRLGFENTPYPQGAFLQQALDTVISVTGNDFPPELTGPEYGAELRVKRIRALKAIFFIFILHFSMSTHAKGIFGVGGKITYITHDDSHTLPKVEGFIETKEALGGNLVGRLDFAEQGFLRYWATELSFDFSLHPVQARNTRFDDFSAGKVSLFTTSWSILWMFTPDWNFSPYLGVGASYVYMKEAGIGSADRLQYTSKPGGLLQGGVKFYPSRHWSMDFDVKKIGFVSGTWRPMVTLTKNGITGANDNSINPLIVGLGATYYFW